MSSRSGALAALAGLLLFAAAACGGDPDERGDPGRTGTSPPTVAATATPADLLGAYAGMEIPEDLADGDNLGRADAPVTLALYEDFQCPFCLAFNLQFEGILVEEYVAPGKVLLQFRHYTILGEESINAARASVCVADQDVFWEFHNRLFLEQARAGQLTNERINIGRFSDANLRTYAVEAGADAAEFDACYADTATLARVQADVREARDLGLRGTPGVVLDGVPVSIPRDLAALRNLLDEAIAAKE